MNKLFSFYLPHILKNILLTFLTFVLVYAATLLMPLGEDSRSITTTILMGLVFPGVVYFSPSNYLSYSLNWILQTPVKKSEIILTNGLLNITKIVIVFVLINIFYLCTSKGDWNVTPVVLLIKLISIEILGEKQVSIDSRFSEISFMVACLIFLFALLPDITRSLQEAAAKKALREQTLKNRFSPKNLKTYSKVFIGLCGITILFEYVPPFIENNLLLIGFIAGSVFLTLRSVQYNYQKSWLFSGALILSIAGSFLTYTIAQKEVYDASFPLDLRIKSASILGQYDKEASILILSEISKGEKNSVDIGRTDLSLLFNTLKDRKMRQAFTLTLQKNCSEKLDHSCRLATYAVEFNSEQKPKIDLIRQGCPNDLYSCEILRTSHLSNEDDIKLGEDHLAEKCKLNPEGFEGKVCRIYFKSKTSGKKVKT